MNLRKSDGCIARDRRQRTLPGFCVQAYQKNTMMAGPEKTTGSKRPAALAMVAATKTSAAQYEETGATRCVPLSDPQTTFASMYGRPGFPLTTLYGSRSRWLVPMEKVDYEIYMPVMVDGLRNRARPYGTCAAYGLWDMLDKDETGERVLSALPRTVFPLRRALDRGPRDWPTVVRALKTLRRLATVGVGGSRVGMALMSYYRQLLPPIGRYMRTATHVTSTDGLNPNIRYNIKDLCAETLATLNLAGGPCAFANIKYVIPTYENINVCNPDFATEYDRENTMFVNV